MTDYRNMSDFEINRLVARSIDGLHGDDRTACDCYLEAGVGRAVKIPDGDIGWFIMDYCNNPTDAWPIITENNISLIFDNPSSVMATNNCVGWYSDEEPPIHSSSNNPLRAAMIVFLMMKDAENDNPHHGSNHSRMRLLFHRWPQLRVLLQIRGNPINHKDAATQPRMAG